MADRPLTPRQERFVECYLARTDLNATAAARDAGYAPGTAKQEAARLMKKPEIRARIDAAKKARSERTGITQDLVLQELLCLLRVDIGRAFRPDGSMLPLQPVTVKDPQTGEERVEVMPEEIRRAIAGVEVLEEFAGRGEERVQVGWLKKIRLLDKTSAIGLAMRHLGMFDKDRLKHEGLEGLEIVIRRDKPKAQPAPEP